MVYKNILKKKRIIINAEQKKDVSLQRF